MKTNTFSKKESTCKRILVVSQLYPPDLTAGSFRISETAMWLQRLGFEVTVLTARPHRVSVGDTARKSDLKRIRTIRVPLFSIGARGGLWYVLQFGLFAINALLWGVFSAPARFDYVIASSPPLPVGIAGWLLAKAKRAKFVFDVRDLWPDTAVAVGELSERGALTILGRWLERFLYKHAQLITCVSREMKRVIAQRCGEKARIAVIYNGVDWQDNSMANETETYNRPTALKTVAYAGNLGKCQGLEILVRVAAQWPDIQFLIIGTGVQRPALEELSRTLEVSNVKFLGPYSRDIALEKLRSVSAVFLQLRDREVFAKTIPSKIFDYLTLNHPIIYGLRGEAAAILAKSGGNLAFEPDNVQSLSQTIALLKRDYGVYLDRADGNCRIAALFTREVMSRKLVDLLEDL